MSDSLLLTTFCRTFGSARHSSSGLCRHTHSRQTPNTRAGRQRMYSVGSLPKFRISVRHSERNSASIWKVSAPCCSHAQFAINLFSSISSYRQLRKCSTTLSTELQGHAIKNQDLLIASGAISLKGSDGMSAVDDDVAAAVSFLHSLQLVTLLIGLWLLLRHSTLALLFNFHHHFSIDSHPDSVSGTC